MAAFILLLSSFSQAQTVYNLSSGGLPPCNGSWNVNGSTYTCSDRVTLSNGSSVIANSAVTLSANNGFNFSNNTIGSSANNILVRSSYGTVDATATTTIYGNIQSDSGNITLSGTIVSGAVTTGGNVKLTGGRVNGRVTSFSNNVTTNGTNLLGGVTSNSGMSITGGTVSGSFILTANTLATFSGVTMTSGSIAGASTVTVSNSTLGSSNAAITINSNSGAISLSNSVIYGNLTAPNYSTVNVPNGSAVYGTCVPGSTPANACIPAPPSCPDGGSLQSGLLGEYFNNRSLSGDVTNTRVDAQVNYDWTSSSPGVTGIGADQFSVRWQGYIRVTESGNYRFQTASDDGVRLWVNDQLLINNWSDHSNTTDTSSNIKLTAGEVYTIRLEFYENGGQALIRLRWRLPSENSYVAIPAGSTPVYGAGLYYCASGAQVCASGDPSSGIKGRYFNNIGLSGSPAGTRVDGPIDFDWSDGLTGVSGVNADQFSVSWEGRVRAPVTGDYQFQTVSDDGIRVWVNEQLLIDQWNDHSATTHTSNSIRLLSGQSYSIRVEFYENFVYAVMRLRWLVPGTSSFVAIPRGPTPALGAGLYYCPSGPTVSYYTITHAGTGVTCEGSPITITAFDSAGNMIAPPANTIVELSTAPDTGFWVGGNGYSFTGEEMSFTKYLQQTSPAGLNINVFDGTATEIPSADANIIFTNAALKFYNNSSLAPLANIFAGTENSTAIVRAIKTNPETKACEAGTVGVTTMKLGYECRDPITCSSGQSFQIINTAITANNSGSSGNLTSVPVTFNSNGIAPIPLSFSDVGKVRLLGQLTTVPSTANDPAVTLTGASDPFVVKPYTLVVSSVPGNPGTEGTGAGFKAADDVFSVNVQARNAKGAITPNFGREISPEYGNVTLKLMGTVYPTSGKLGQLANGEGNFSLTTPAGTIVNNQLTWNEVGTINVQAEFGDNDYLGAGDLFVKTLSGSIGRFYPAYFSLDESTLENGCGTFTYLGQDNIRLSYTLTAKSVLGKPTENYSYPGYAQTAKLAYAAEFNDSLDLSSRVTATEVNWTNGVLRFDSTPPSGSQTVSLLRQPSGAPDGPFMQVALGLKISSEKDNRAIKDLDMNAATAGSCEASGNCDAKLLNDNLELRYGRMQIKDAYGSEAEPLPMFWQTEYWNGSRFVVNDADSCTALPLSQVDFTGATTSVDEVNDTDSVTLNGITSVFDFSGDAATDGLTNSAILFVSGKAGRRYGAPGSQVTYPINVNLTALPWLRYDWNQDGDFSDTGLPPVDINFSHYRGHDRVIYWREDYSH